MASLLYHLSYYSWCTVGITTADFIRLHKTRHWRAERSISDCSREFKWTWSPREDGNVPAKWWQPYSCERWPHPVPCCVQGSGVISWGGFGKFPLPPPQPHRQQRPHCGESSERDTRVHRLPLISLQDSGVSAGFTISFVEPADTTDRLECLYWSSGMGPTMSLQGISDGNDAAPCQIQPVILADVIYSITFL